jgi:uncharacterized peroxidase-related enzyme
MTTFPVHTAETAPDSKSILDTVQQGFGFVPNLMGVMAESPQVVEAYLTLMGLFDKTSLSDIEREVVLMTNNRVNHCTYCMAAHTTVAQMKNLPADVINALRDGNPIVDAKLEALRVFAEKVTVSRGNPTAADVEALLAAGYTNRTVLEVVLGTSMKVLSNYTNHIAETPLDQAFEANAWKGKECCNGEQDSCSVETAGTKDSCAV